MGYGKGNMKSWQLKTLKSWITWIDIPILLILLLLVLPSIIPRFLLADILAWSILIYGFNLLYGLLGYLSFGHIGYFAVGSYTFAVAVQHFHIDPILAIIVALLAGAFVGAILGVILIREGGVYFALINLAVSVTIYYIALYFLKDYTGGFEGRVIDLRHGIIDLSTREAAYLVITMAFMATYIFYKILNKSTFALLLQAMKESEDRVKFLGYDTFLIKYSAFVISTSLSALGGAMLALSNAYVGATTYAPEHNGEVVVMSMLGGPASIFGAPVGAALYLGLKYVIGAYIIRWELVVGILLLVAMILARGLGICGIIEQILRPRITAIMGER
jgi:branched-chain amino acid transport system permease protein